MINEIWSTFKRRLKYSSRIHLLKDSRDNYFID